MVGIDYSRARIASTFDMGDRFLRFGSTNVQALPDLLDAEQDPFPGQVVGCKEGYTAWHLLCRTGPELATLADEVPPRAIARTEVFEAPDGMLAFPLPTKH
jgi:hypothetical protein